MRNIWVISVLLSLGLVACGDAGLTLTEYASRLEEEVAVMNSRIDEIDVGLRDPASVDEALRLWDERVTARERFLRALEDLVPPENVKMMHAAAVDVMDRLTAAEAAMGVRAAEEETVVDLGRIWDTVEGRTARAVDEEAVAFCRVAQAEFDETADREILADVAWITSDMKEIIDVVFGCTREERD